MKIFRDSSLPRLDISATALIIAALVFIFVGCGGKTVKRVASDSTIDLSGNWNDTDSRLVAEEMLNDCLTKPWYQNAVRGKNGENPVIVIGQIRNLSTEHINTGTFINDIQRVLINSGKVEFVANSEERQQLRKEIDDQKGNATDETAKERGQETGADIMLTGTINSIVDQSGSEQVKFYQIDLELTDLQSHKKLWIGNKKIKKFIEKSALKL
ncbi:MAG: penicillin-binding protein activator LpoB [Fibromonadaceae bacterium]|nr:penicillin-binding protein activator LpoB [Fibromonadaceae bacterium]